MVRVTNDFQEALRYIYDNMSNKELKKYVEKLHRDSFKKGTDFYSIIHVSHLDVLDDVVKKRLEHTYCELMQEMILKSLEEIKINKKNYS